MSQEQPEVAPVATKKSSWMDSLPIWISTNLKARKSWKVLFRCWLASWASFVLIIPSASLHVMGNAAFFAMIGSLIIPPSMPVQAFLFAIITMFGGMLFGWAMLSAGTRAAVAARNVVLLRSSLERVQASGAGNANPDALFRIAIFKGESTAVFGCFFGVTIFILALTRAYSPRLLLFSVFGTIVTDIIACYGPLFPFAYYTLPQIVFIPLASYVAIAVVLIILIFPETNSHAYLGLVSSILENSKNAVELQKEVLKTDPKDLGPGSPLTNRVAALRAGLAAQFTGLTLKTKFLDAEFTWGMWNGDDARSLEQPLLGIVARISGMQAFGQMLGHASSHTPGETTDSLEETAVDENNNTWGDTYMLRQIFQRRNNAEREHSVALTDIMPILDEATQDLRTVISEGLSSCVTAIDWANKRRYNHSTVKDLDEQYESVEIAMQKLSATLERFKLEKRNALFVPFETMFASAATFKEENCLPTRSLNVANVFVANIIVFAEVLLAFMTHLLTVMCKRKTRRLWAPKGLRALWKLVTDQDHEQDQVVGEDTISHQDIKEQREQPYRRDPDSRPAQNLFQSFMNSLNSLYNWASTAEALFAFKYTFISIALWLPSVFKSSAYFCYVEKSLWALIMAQTTLNVYAADQIFNYFTRLGGTFVGAVYGLLAWYIGAGRGNGNPYGNAASAAVFMVPVVFVRLFAPIQYVSAAVLGSVTFALVIGYSWVDGNLTVLGSPGVGWPIGWKRWTLVVIGSAASFIVMMIPPRSGRTAVRLQTASTINSLANLYAFIMSSWIADGELSATSHKGSQEKNEKPVLKTSAFALAFRQKIIDSSTQLQILRQRTDIAKWEGNLRGKWPYEQYSSLVDIQNNMLTSLGQMGSALSHLDNEWRLSFLNNTKVVNPSFITDVMSNFTMVSAALRNAEPLHEVLHQSLLDRLCYHDIAAVGKSTNKGESQPRSLEHMRSIDYTYYTAALVAVLQVVESLREIQEITKDLCGEVPFQGFGDWREQYNRTHLAI